MPRPKLSDEQKKAAERQVKLNEALAKYQSACLEYHETLLDGEEKDWQELSKYLPFAEQLAQSNHAEASFVGLLARVLRLEVAQNIRSEPPSLETIE